MNEIFDRLLIRILLVGVVLGVLALYQWAHHIFYPTGKAQIGRRFDPSENPADTLHLFARLTGFVMILSSLRFDEGHGIMLSLFHYIVWGGLTAGLYLGSLFLVESIVLFNFEYRDEVLKRRNLTYALVCAAHALAIAHVTRVVVDQAENSLVILLILWMLAMVVMGFGSKYFQLLSRLHLDRMVGQDQPAVAVSYAGFTLGLGWLVGESFNHEHFDITMYCVQVLLKIMLALIVYPLFRKGLRMLFRVDLPPGKVEHEKANWGLGVFECALFLSSAVMTSMIVNHIRFGTIYPFF
jgi:hypothetical protein